LEIVPQRFSFSKDLTIELLFRDQHLSVNKENNCTTFYYTPNGEANRSFSVRIQKNLVSLDSPLHGCYTPYIYFAPNVIYISERLSYIKEKCRIEINEELIPEFICYGHLVPPVTLIKNLQIVPFNCTVEIFINYDAKVECNYLYKNFSHEEYDKYSDNDTKKTEKFLLDSFKTIDLEKSVFLLSGGMDSGVLYKLMKNNIHQYTNTWSTSYPFFDQRGDIEKEYAISASEYLGVQKHNHIATTTRDYFKSLLQTVKITEEPNCFNQTPLFNMLFKNIYEYEENLGCVVINGMGADCILGTGFHRKLFALEKLKIGLPIIHGVINRILNKVCPQYSSIIRYKDVIKYKSNINDYHHILWDFNNRRDYRFTDELFKEIPKHSSRLDILNRIPEHIDLLSKFTYIDLFAEMSISQRQWGRLSSEYGGGGVFFPFLDSSVVQHMFNYSWDVKLKEHKKLLLDVGRKLGISEEILLRSKSGMSVDPNSNLNIYNSFISIIRKNIKSDFDDIYDSHASLKTKLTLTNFLLWKHIVVEENDLDELFFDIDNKL
jgi:hypothetical protein